MSFLDAAQFFLGLALGAIYMGIGWVWYARKMNRGHEKLLMEAANYHYGIQSSLIGEISELRGQLRCMEATRADRVNWAKKLDVN